MDATGELIGQDGVDAALPGDAVLSGKALGNDLDSKMRLLAAMGPGMMSGMEVGIIVDFQTRRLQRGLQFLANSLGYAHARSHRSWAASWPKKSRCEALLAAIGPACHRSTQPPYSAYAPSALFL